MISAKLRKQVWERDKGICDLCGLPVPWRYYECGHKVDAVQGGSETDPDNLTVMCIECNRTKPMHSTIEEYNAWKASDGLREWIYAHYEWPCTNEQFEMYFRAARAIKMAEFKGDLDCLPVINVWTEPEEVEKEVFSHLHRLYDKNGFWHQKK